MKVLDAVLAAALLYGLGALFALALQGYILAKILILGSAFCVACIVEATYQRERHR
jgi:hypothetical protein